MPECPNCGQATARTEDWACQWCGYPLLSGSYKKIAKTFKQLKEEEPPEPEPSSEEEALASPLPHQVPLAPADTAEVELTLEPKQVPKPELVLKVKQISEPEGEAAAEPKPEPAPEPEPVRQPEPEPVAAAKETTVKELISAYAEDEATANAQFVDKIIKLTGVVTKIEVNDVLDVHYIVLSSVDKKLPQSVRCLFDKKYEPELKRLAKEQTVTVQGKYNGSIIAMRMRDCVLAP